MTWEELSKMGARVTKYNAGQPAFTAPLLVRRKVLAELELRASLLMPFVKETARPNLVGWLIVNRTKQCDVCGEPNGGGWCPLCAGAWWRAKGKA